MWEGVPTPGDPNDRPPGFFFPNSQSSARFFAGRFAGTATSVVRSNSNVTGAKPLIGS
jgi:hypothetical protein